MLEPMVDIQPVRVDFSISTYGKISLKLYYDEYEYITNKLIHFDNFINLSYYSRTPYKLIRDCFIDTNQIQLSIEKLR